MWVQCLSLSRRRQYTSENDIISAITERVTLNITTGRWAPLVQACEHVVWTRDWSAFQEIYDLLLASLSVARSSFSENDLAAVERHVQMMYLLYMLESGKQDMITIYSRQLVPDTAVAKTQLFQIGNFLWFEVILVST
jgi:hypothetical protein